MHPAYNAPCLKCSHTYSIIHTVLPHPTYYPTPSPPPARTLYQPKAPESKWSFWGLTALCEEPAPKSPITLVACVFFSLVLLLGACMLHWSFWRTLPLDPRSVDFCEKLCSWDFGEFWKSVFLRENTVPSYVSSFLFTFCVPCFCFRP